MLLNSFFRINQTVPLLFNEVGSGSISLEPGTYTFVIRGGGGAGGEYGGAIEGPAQFGGAGGKGEIKVYNVSVESQSMATIFVGSGGLTHSAGGNGGLGGASSGIGSASAGGAGGGGGMPSYVFVNNTYYFALGGGGGGGAGGNSIHHRGRYEGGSGSGGGGGYYRFNNGTITSVPGKSGQGGSGYNTRGKDGIAGNTTDFPNIVSGVGGSGGSYSGQYNNGGYGAYGGGASGGSGGGGPQNTDYARGGAGGGGAGGSVDAGGGHGGVAWERWAGSNVFGGNGTNFHTTPTDTTNENAQNGIMGNYGIGGATNTNGVSGCVLIYKG